MFVAFDDYVLVIEAPLNDGLTQQTIAVIKKTAPGKPIRYVVPTHYHRDHIGGLRGFVAEGVTVVTTPSVKTEIEKLVAQPRSLRPDTLSRNPAALKTEILNEKRVLADATHRVELYNISPNPHAADLVVAYFPTVKTLYEADALDLPVVGDPSPGGPTTVALMQELQALKLEVKTIIPAHGRQGAIEDLKIAASLAQ
jgi:glyoxylase-like metal-dependent hydrolase (beta-lactamase superfamily II)